MVTRKHTMCSALHTKLWKNRILLAISASLLVYFSVYNSFLYNATVNLYNVGRKEFTREFMFVENATKAIKQTSAVFKNTTKRPSTKEPTTTTTKSWIQPFLENSVNDDKSKIEQRNVFFLKTHKTASSTVLNILHRYAEKHDLFIGLPKYAASFLYGYEFNKNSVVLPPNGKEINLMFHHMVFNYKEVKSILPKNTTFVTSLRDSATQFESTFQYFFNFVETFKRAGERGPGTLDRWLNNTNTYFVGKENSVYWYAAKNYMAFDLGLDNLNETDAYIEKAIFQIEDQFDFVIISEYFDISMILLKDLLGWELEDIVSFKTNARKSDTVEVLSSTTAENIRKWNKLDAALYKHFNKTFWKKVKDFGAEKMKKELYALEILRNSLSSLCLNKDTVENKNIKDSSYKVYLPDGGIKITGFELNESVKGNTICQGLARPELSWLKRAQSKQAPKPVETKGYNNAQLQPNFPAQKKPLSVVNQISGQNGQVINNRANNVHKKPRALGVQIERNKQAQIQANKINEQNRKPIYVPKDQNMAKPLVHHVKNGQIIQNPQNNLVVPVNNIPHRQISVQNQPAAVEQSQNVAKRTVPHNNQKKT